MTTELYPINGAEILNRDVTSCMKESGLYGEACLFKPIFHYTS